MPIDSLSLEERLSLHPQLHQKIEQLVSVVESTGDDCALADEAERQVIEVLRQMGQEALSAWANQRIEHTSAHSNNNPALRSCGQKNSTGAPPTESSP